MGIIVIDEKGYTTTGDAYTSAVNTYPYNVNPQPKTLVQNIDDFYVRRPLDYKKQFFLFRDEHFEIVKGDEKLTSVNLKEIFKNVTEYLELDYVLDRVNNNDNVDDYLPSENYLVLNDNFSKDYTSILILPIYKLLVSEEEINWRIDMKFGDLGWTTIDRLFFWSSKNELPNITLRNSMSESIKLKIVLFK